MERLALTIEGMSCQHCVKAVRDRLSSTPGIEVEDVRIGSAVMRYDPARVNIETIEELVADVGYTAARP